ncbi:MAG: xylulokinase [Amaricoccus sp.]|uniref:xylulokinase n=1 Tax=Amaricoccus sp. TaxID=1872485 RepID=UPI0039E5410F
MYLGLDLGTSGLKALLCDSAQQPLAVARAAYPIQSPGPGLAEQDPALWIAAARQAVAEIRARVPAVAHDLRAIGLSGQMHGLVALDADGSPLRPAMLWNDSRGEGFLARVRDGFPDLAAITGVGAMTSFTAAKLDWLAENEPACFVAIRKIVLPKDFVRLWLTGDWATDASDAGGTQLFDQGARRWSPEVCAFLGLDPETLPPILEATATAGTLRPAVADALGLPRVPVICGGADAATGALATACVDSRLAMISLGTGALYLAASDAYAPPDNPTLHHFAHCLPGRWYRMAAILGCGSVFDWACALTGAGSPAAALDAIDARGWSGPGPVLMLPYLDGVRTPHGDPRAKGAIFGLDRATDGRDLVQAALEGVCFALADADRVLRASSTVAEVPMVIGGGARSRTWTRMLATVLGRPLAVADGAEGGSALGAVRLAMLGSGLSLAEVAVPPAAHEVAPDRALGPACEDRLAAFRALYPPVAAYGGGEARARSTADQG